MLESALRLFLSRSRSVSVARVITTRDGETRNASERGTDSSQFHVNRQVSDALAAQGLPIVEYDGGVNVWAKSFEDLMSVSQCSHFSEGQVSQGWSADTRHPRSFKTRSTIAS